jgi:predicted  nucleic acid-binding Zn-ribbon protein
MASLSDLNKKERELRGSISRLRKQLRDKEISKKDFDKAFKASSKDLEKISEEKGRIIGEALPPLPPPPRPSNKPGKLSGLDAIKKSILRDRDIEPPGPPLIIKQKPPEPPTVLIKEKPPESMPPKTIVEEKIKEAPVIKEKIKKVPFPVIKEKIKEVPAIKEARAPGPGPGMAKRIEENAREIRNLQVDLTRNEQEVAQFLKESREARQRLEKLEEMKGDLKALKSRIDRIDFQGLTKEIYGQFEKMNSSIREAEKKTDDLVEKFSVELKTLRESMGESVQAKEHVESLDISNIRRDMESLKQKSQYIEQHLEKVDMQPIVDMIREVENKVNTLKASSALIIE